MRRFQLRKLREVSYLMASLWRCFQQVLTQIHRTEELPTLEVLTKGISCLIESIRRCFQLILTQILRKEELPSLQMLIKWISFLLMKTFKNLCPMETNLMK